MDDSLSEISLRGGKSQNRHPIQRHGSQGLESRKHQLYQTIQDVGSSSSRYITEQEGIQWSTLLQS